MRKPGQNTSLDWRGYLLGIGLVVVVTLIKYFAQPSLIPPGKMVLYMLAIVPPAIFFGFGPAILAALLSLLSWDFFFVPPLHSIGSNSIQQLDIWITFFLVGVIISYLSSGLRHKNQIANKEILNRKKAEAEILKYQEQLEELVKQRTSELEQTNTNLKQEIIERKKIEEALRQSEQRWETTLASIGDAVIATDNSGRITFMNATAEDLTGWQFREANDKPITEIFNIINEFSRQKVDNPVSKVLQQGGVVGLANHTILVRKDGKEVPIDDSGAPIRGQDGRNTGVVLVFRDISERKIAEEKLKESEIKFRTMADYTYDWEYWTGPDGYFEYISPSCERVTGYRPEEFINHPDLLKEIVHPEDKLFFSDHIKEIYNDKFSMDFRIITRNDEIRWISHRCQPIITSEGRSLGQRVSNRDITERKKAEEALAKAKAELEIKVKDRTLELEQANKQLKLYSQRITQVQEEERKRIAYELHDDTAQYLSILKLQLDSLLQSGKIHSPEIREKLEYLEKDASRAVDDIRRYSHELRPTILEHLGLQAAIEQIAEDINKLKQITVEVNVDGAEPEMPEDVKLGFFRIVQEALNNCRKHARASSAVINLKFQENQMELAVSDNGIGFDLQEAATRSGLKGSLGLMSMQERAKLIEADLKIESKPGQGTTVSVNKTMTG